MSIDLQDALNMTVRSMLNGAGLHGVPDYRTVEIQLDDDGTGHLVCPDHEYVIADLDDALQITVEHGCVECDILECRDCDTRRQHLCTKHRAAVAS